MVAPNPNRLPSEYSVREAVTQYRVRATYFLSIAAVNALLLVLSLGLYRLMSGMAFLVTVAITWVVVIASLKHMIRLPTVDVEKSISIQAERRTSPSFFDNLGMAFVMPLFGVKKPSGDKVKDNEAKSNEAKSDETKPVDDKA